MGFLQVIVVILGVAGNILSTILCISPIKSFLEIDKKRDTGNVNIYPIIALCGNSMSWVIYGSVDKSATVLPVNTFGTFTTLYFIMVYYGATNNPYHRRKLALLFITFLLLITVFSLLVILMTTQEQASTILGFSTNTILFTFFASPIFNLYKVLKQRDNTSIILPLAFSTFVASTVWTFYGILVENGFIWVPNSFGAFLGVVQLVIYFLVNHLNRQARFSPPIDKSGDDNTFIIQVDEDEQKHLEMDVSDHETI